MTAPTPRRCNAGMFIGDEVRARADAAAATTRLAGLARGSSLTQASHAAWDAGIPRAGQGGPGLPRLLRVRCQGPVRRGAVSVLMLRWEAADGNGQPFPSLDADIILIPDGVQATLVGLAGVYRTPAGTGLDWSAVHGIAAVTIRTLLIRIADAISDPTREPLPLLAVRHGYARTFVPADDPGQMPTVPTWIRHGNRSPASDAGSC